MSDLTCVICQRRQPRTGMVCDPDRDWLARVLGEIPELYALLDPEPGTTVRHQRVSGSREIPIPLRVDAFDLLGPPRLESVHDESRDQTGCLSVATVLDSWAQDWRETRDMGEHAPVPTVWTLAGWLSVRLDWACTYHLAIDEFASEMFALAGVLRWTCGATEPKPKMLDAPCARCDNTSLHRLSGEDWVECGVCGRLMTEDEYQRYVGLVVAHHRRGAA